MERRNKPSEIKSALFYYLLLSCATPESIEQWPAVREQLGIHTDKIIHDVCQRIVSFHHAKRYPDEQLVHELETIVRKADSSVQDCFEFQQIMAQLAALPARSKMKNRLHCKRGCQFCAFPCRYGYLSLLMELDLSRMEVLIKTEAEKLNGRRKVVSPIWQFTMEQIGKCLPINHVWQITPEHLGNLSYCLLALATSKSRFPYPAAEMNQFQNMNQNEIHIQGQH